MDVSEYLVRSRLTKLHGMVVVVFLERVNLGAAFIEGRQPQSWIGSLSHFN